MTAPMKRTNLLVIITILFILVVALLGGGYFYLTSTRPALEEAVVKGSGSLAEITQTASSSPTNDTTLSSTSSSIGTLPKLRHLTTAPVAGYDFVDNSKGFVVWYVDRATGNVFQTATSSAEVTRITNTTIPKVYEAYIGKEGTTVILRTLNSMGAIQTFIGSPKTKTVSTSTDTTKELAGVFTTDVISFLAISPTKDRFFGMTGGTTGIGNIYSFTTKSSNIFSHPLKKWLPQWVNASTIVLTSAPSAKTQNISYLLNPATKGFTKLLGPRNGLVVSGSSDATHFLFSENSGNALVFGIYDAKKGTETSISNATIPDKCVWSKKNPSTAYCGFPKSVPTGIFPDDWYQGKTFFDDAIRSIHTDTLRLTTVSDLENGAGQIDAINLALSSDERYLLFTNKRDLTLWMLEL